MLYTTPRREKPMISQISKGKNQREEINNNNHRHHKHEVHPV